MGRAREAPAVESTPDASNSIEIPGVGRFSLNPADYDAQTLSDLFQQDFGAGVALVRERYADAVTALTSGDSEKLSELAGPVVEKLTRAQAVPLVSDAVRDALIDTPQPEYIARGSGTPIYYVNGIFTPIATARDEARELANRLPGSTVALLYNHGTPPSEDTEAAGQDISEAFRDRIWPLQLSRRLKGNAFGSGIGAWLSGDSGQDATALQHNPTTRQLAGALHAAATTSPTGSVAIVGYSQGAMIARNALYTLAVLGKQSFAENRVAFVAPGLPINNKEVWPVPKRFTPLVDPKDPVPAYLGLQGEGLGLRGAAIDHHRWLEIYVSRITPDMVTVS